MPNMMKPTNWKLRRKQRWAKMNIAPSSDAWAIWKVESQKKFQSILWYTPGDKTLAKEKCTVLGIKRQRRAPQTHKNKKWNKYKNKDYKWILFETNRRKLMKNSLW